MTQGSWLWQSNQGRPPGRGDMWVETQKIRRGQPWKARTASALINFRSLGPGFRTCLPSVFYLEQDGTTMIWRGFRFKACFLLLASVSLHLLTGLWSIKPRFPKGKAGLPTSKEGTPSLIWVLGTDRSLQGPARGHSEGVQRVRHNLAAGQQLFFSIEIAAFLVKVFISNLRSLVKLQAPFENKNQIRNLRTFLAVQWLRFLPMQAVWVQSMVGEVRSHMPCGQKAKT